MTKRVVYIYTLIDPFTNRVFYVGQTSNIKQRFYQHCSHGNKHNKTKRQIMGILESGSNPVMDVIFVTDFNNWARWEIC